MMLTISEEEKKNIFKCLNELNICNRCILRYLGYNICEHGIDTFLNSGCIINELFHIDEESCNENKKLKKNPCRSCLNVLDDTVIENYASVITDEFEKYDIQNFYTTLNFPVSISIREFGMFLYLKEKFPDIYKQFIHIEKIKRVFRTITSNTFSLKLKRPFKEDSNLQLNINIVYQDEEKEMENLVKVITAKKISKKTIDDFLNLCSDEVFKKHFPIPPAIQDKETSATVNFSSSIAFLGGRYLKFSREMGQTPFIVNNTPITEHSVQEVIFDSIAKVLKCDKQKLTFSASGREDSDTRMLGEGRPFYIQIDDPLFEKITPQQCQDIEQIISQSNTVVVIKLQQVSQESTKKIKFGEQEKRKHYRALCKSLAPNVENAISTVNLMICPLAIQQATPIRVLHRRTHLIRERLISEIKATPVEGYSNLFYLDVITEAGTYVKEFVNGDFHRTNPNLCDTTGYPVDVVALDVTAVELDWPCKN
ncbi:unnamed protein product [Psylliodes chrysocephalus]|uniref:tRNA pseudouridine(55) synthase n=1 Tax=Psylliodes chrysocephalus TaxID=3402493 RepID=A0A9P0GKA6_9CUCU|nr:unnamed protein product [Psylliodes chrysocephala]